MYDFINWFLYAPVEDLIIGLIAAAITLKIIYSILFDD